MKWLCGRSVIPGFALLTTALLPVGQAGAS